MTKTRLRLCVHMDMHLNFSCTNDKLCKYTEYVHTSGELLTLLAPLKVSFCICKVENDTNLTELKWKLKEIVYRRNLEEFLYIRSLQSMVAIVLSLLLSIVKIKYVRVWKVLDRVPGLGNDNTIAVTSTSTSTSTLTENWLCNSKLLKVRIEQMSTMHGGCVKDKRIPESVCSLCTLTLILWINFLLINLYSQNAFCGCSCYF